MGDILYTEVEANLLLYHYIKRFWKYTNPTEGSQSYTILPDGYFDLVVKISNNTIDNISLFGLCTNEIEVEIPAKATILGICFKPLASEYILRRSIAPILNSHETLANEFWKINLIPLDDFKFWTDKISDQMKSNLNDNKIFDSRKINIFNLLFKPNPMLNVQELSNKVFWNPRQINRYFKNKLGISLKAYINVVRCFATYVDIREGELSPSLEFYDQSHFIKEIKKHTGFSPTELHKNKNDRFLQFATLPKL